MPLTRHCCKRCEGGNGPDTAAGPSGGGSRQVQHQQAGGGLGEDDGHEAGCARLKADVLRSCWWEAFRCDRAFDEDAPCLVVPPASPEAQAGPAPAILFLCGNGHVNDRQDFLWGGVDVLVRNPPVHDACFLLAPKPTTSNGLLRYNEHGGRAWAEDAVWALFTEVLRRLGPARVDPRCLYATGLSLGAAGVWHLALRYGEWLAAAIPISGHCEWPGSSWKSNASPDEAVLRRLASLNLRAYQIDVDRRAGSPINDMQWLCYELEEHTRDLTLPGMDPGTTCSVHVREWCWKDTGAKWELWSVKGPLQDWSTWDDWGGDKHCLWQRVYPSPEWGVPELFARCRLPEDRKWGFDSEPLVVDTTEVRQALEEEWRQQEAAREAKKQRLSLLEGDTNAAAGEAGPPVVEGEAETDEVSAMPD